MPAPGSAAWWWTRPVFFLIVLGAVWMLSLWLLRFEESPVLGAPTSPHATTLAVVLFVVPVLAITAYGLDAPLAVIVLVLSVVALWLVGARRHAPGLTA